MTKRTAQHVGSRWGRRCKLLASASLGCLILAGGGMAVAMVPAGNQAAPVAHVAHTTVAPEIPTTSAPVTPVTTPTPTTSPTPAPVQAVAPTSATVTPTNGRSSAVPCASACRRSRAE
jgi:hypothetical protein